MAKVQGPLLSMGGGGQIGHSQVYATWKGRPYVRRYVIPANPRSTEQTKTRSAFSFVNDLWRLAPGNFQAPWSAFASGKVMTNRNAFLSKLVSFLRPAGGAALTTLLGITMSPGAKGGLVSAPVITTAGGDIIFTVDPPSPLPAGWSIVSFIGVATPDVDPQTASPGVMLTDAAVDPGPGNPWVATIVAPGSDTYAVGGWFVYQRSASASDLAYGPAVASILVVP